MLRLFRLGTIALCVCTIALTSCSDEDGNPFNYDDISNISYTQHVQPLFSAHCVSCHGPDRSDVGLRLDSWDELIKGSDHGEAIIPFDADNSRMYELFVKIPEVTHPTELGSTSLTPEEMAFIQRWINEGAINDNGEFPYAEATNLLYVCSQDAAIVNIIDMDNNVVIRNVDMTDFGYSAESKPHHVAVEPDGSFWYVTLITDGKVVKFNRANERVAEFDMVQPALLAVHPNNNQLYVSRFMAPGSVLNTIVVLDRSTMTPAAGTEEGLVDVQFTVPHGLAMSPTGDYAYAASLVDSRLIRINTANFDVDFAAVSSQTGPLQVAVAPDNSDLYVSAQVANQLFNYTLNGAETPVVNPAIDVGVRPWHPVYTPDGTTLYVGNNGSNSVSVINTASRTVESTIAGNGLALPHGAAVRPDGKFVYISNRNVDGSYTPRTDLGDNANVGTVVVIDTETNQIAKVLEIEEFGSGMASRPL